MPTYTKRRYPFSGCLHWAFLPLALLLAFYLVRSLSVSYSDFAGYFYGGRELLTGHPANAYDMGTLNTLIRQDGYHDVFVSYAPFPPFTSLVFAPFLLFRMPVAKLIFDVFCSLLFLFTLMRARLFLNIPPFLALILPIVFRLPIVNNLYFGQSYLLLCCLLLEGYMAYKRGQIILSSLSWGVAVVFKVFPGVLLIWLLLQKKYRAALGLCIACTLLLSLSLWLNGWTIWKYYVLEILPKVNNGELNDPFAFIFQSAFMLLKRTFVYDGLSNPHPLIDSPWLFGILLGLFKAVILTVCIRYTLRKKQPDHAGAAPSPGALATAPSPGVPATAPPSAQDFDSFAVWITASMLISPNGSSYSLVLLVIPLLAIMARKTTGHLPWLLPSLLLFAACTIPVAKLDHAPLWEQFPRLYLLLLFFMLLTRPLKMAWNTGLWAGLTAFFILLFLVNYRRDPDPSTYFFAKEEHIFIDDLSVNNGMLVYAYGDDKGSHPVSTGIPITQWQTLEVHDKQIYYNGKPITHSPDIKLKPLLIDGTYILYLSDKNRGPGFYTVRRLPI